MANVVLPNLTPTSTLAELPAMCNSFDASVPGRQVLAEFECRDDLPGVIILAGGEFAAMISREAFFQLMSKAFRREIYLGRPIQHLLSCDWPLQYQRRH